VNIPVDETTFKVNRERAVDYLNTLDRLYVIDGYAGWDERHRLKIRVICTRPYHALFMWTMLIRPSAEDLKTFGEPDFVIFNGGHFPANRYTSGMTSKTSVDLSFEDREFVILGTEYAGEMKKGIFTIMNYLMPKEGQLSMHCSATAAKDNESSSLLFGLSGTGKTTLSANPNRRLVGDDEHVWTDRGIFNIEGGCYAKAINLCPENEPDIFGAVRFGAVMENVVYDPQTHGVDYDNTSITENTRVAYPIEFIGNAKIPCVAGHPTDILFLTCDAFGVLPPVSKLTPEQAMYHFISGYTAKIAGTEMGITEPKVTFSACFGAPFMVWHPGVYAKMLSEKIAKHGVNVWLVNTGWTGGGYGVGKRFALKHTRRIVDQIHEGALASAPTQVDPIFGLHVVHAVDGVPAESLVPENAWSDKGAYTETARNLASLFVENFTQFEDGVSQAVRDAAPRPDAAIGA